MKPMTIYGIKSTRGIFKTKWNEFSFSIWLTSHFLSQWTQSQRSNSSFKANSSCCHKSEAKQILHCFYKDSQSRTKWSYLLLRNQALNKIFELSSWRAPACQIWSNVSDTSITTALAILSATTVKFHNQTRRPLTYQKLGDRLYFSEWSKVYYL